MEPSLLESFYVVGGTLARDAPSYVERGADKRLLTALQQGEICYVLTSRQMGKSSLMVRTAVRLREEGTSVAVLDLTSLGQNLTAVQWYNGLLERTGQQLSLEDEVEESWFGSEHLGPFQRWVQAMRRVVLPACKGRVVVFIDEIDTVRSLPFPTDEFFAGIRELYNRRSEEPDLKRLTFCLLGVATPADLIRDTRTTPFNIGRRIELTDFNSNEALPLATGMARDEAVGQRLLKRILYWTGGHPYLTQRMCQAVAESSRIDNPKSVDGICTDLFLSNRARERDDNLLFVRDRMLRSEVDTAALLTLYSKVRAGKKVHDDETNPLIGVLRLSGITSVDDGYLKVRNRIYEHVFDQDWIISNLPGSELRRQRAAYKRGFKRAALVTVPLLLLIGLGGYVAFYRESVTAPPAIGKHYPPPAFWMSSGMHSYQPKLMGSLLLKIGEENVTVFVNEQQYGVTGKTGELSIPALDPGLYNIRLEKPGFQIVTTQRVPVFANNESPLTFTLQPLLTSGEMKVIDVPPDTTVRLDNTIVGVTDASGSLSFKAIPGDHRLDFVKEGYLPESVSQRVSLGKTDTVSVKLRPDPEFLDWRALAESKDQAAFIQYAGKYPNGRYATEARRKAGELEWETLKDSTEIEKLDAFRSRHLQTPLANEATKRIDQLLSEQADFRIAETTNAIDGWQQFLGKHPSGAYTQQAENRLTNLQEQGAVLAVLRKFEDAYNHKDMDSILHLCSKCSPGTQKHLRTLFTDGQSGTLKLEPKLPLTVENGSAVVDCEETRVIPTGAQVQSHIQVKLMKEAGSWVIYGGAL